MIKEVKGDILLTGAQAIAHGVAPHDHFDTGLALTLRKNYPAMVKDFRHFCKTHSAESGGVWTWGTVGNFKIFNLMTQSAAKTHHGHPGPATLPNVNHCLKELASQIKKENITSLAIPKLATGFGKLAWEDVFPLIEQKLGNLDIPIYVYTTYIKDQKAEEH